MNKRAHPAGRTAHHATMLHLRLAVADLADPRAWTRLLDVAARHPGRGVNDVLLIARQRPDATELATYDQWRARGAQVRRGERGMALLRPLDDTGDTFDVVKVFDVTQTNTVPSPRRPAPDLVPVMAALATLADRAGLTVRLRQGLSAAVRADGDRLDLAADLPISTTAGHLVQHLARRLLPAGPARDVLAAGVARIIARRFGLQPPGAEVPASRDWAELLDPAALDRAVVDAAAAILDTADSLTVRLRQALAQPAQPSPTVPMPTPTRRTPRPRPGRAAAPAAEAVDQATLYAATAAAAAFYATHLPASRAAAAYLRSRGIAAAADPGGGWQLGVAPPGGDALLRHLRSLGFSPQVMLDAGLVAAGRLHGGDLYDLFRDRLMFPIHAPDGRIAGFTGRDLSGRSRAKFYNTSETAIFRKGELLYGLAPQLRANGAPTQFVVVEGPTDTIAAHQTYGGLAGEGVTTVAVAPGGTAFTAAQLALLAAHAAPGTSLIMSFDTDDAGARALDRAYPLAVTWPHGRVLSTGPAGFKDIAALLAARGADEALLDLLAAERPLPLRGVERALARAFPDGFHADWPEARVRAYRAVAPYLLDAVRQDAVDLVVQAAAERLGLVPHEITDGIVAHFAADPSG